VTLITAPQDRPYDEAFAGWGAPRPHYARLLAALGEHDLEGLSRTVAARMTEAGLDFGDETFSVDPVPRLLTAAEGAVLRAGLAQRVRALNAFVLDAYGERRICAAGVMDERVIDGAEGYEPDLRGRWPDAVIPIGIAGLDVVRDERGELLVLEDNVRMPSGYAYAATANAVLDDVLPDDLVPREDAGPGLLAALRETLQPADDGVTVVLGDGPGGAAAFEHEAAADALGVPLVTLDDLQARRGGVHVRDEQGGLQRVACVYRRCAQERLRHEDGTTTALSDVLLRPWLAGQVQVVNAFGTGVADDKLSHAYVEEMVRFYLGEEPILRSVPTLDLADDERRGIVLDDLREHVVKPRGGYGGNGVVVCGDATDDDVRAVDEDIRRDPSAYVAQRTIALSQHPTIVDGRLTPRHVDLRPFVFVSGDDVRVFPGGLTRVAWGEGALVVNSSQHGGAKPTWVLR